jgi:hypothetical protein
LDGTLFSCDATASLSESGRLNIRWLNVPDALVSAVELPLTPFTESGANVQLQALRQASQPIELALADAGRSSWLRVGRRPRIPVALHYLVALEKLGGRAKLGDLRHALFEERGFAPARNNLSREMRGKPEYFIDTGEEFWELSPAAKSVRIVLRKSGALP